MKMFLLLLSISVCCSEAAHLDHPPAAMTVGADQSPDDLTQRSSTPRLPHDPDDGQWRSQVLDLLTRLVQHQEQTVRLLGVLEAQGSQQIQDLQAVSRHQSLLIENNQALLLQTSRIGSHLTQLTRKTPPPSDITPVPALRWF